MSDFLVIETTTITRRYVVKAMDTAEVIDKFESTAARPYYCFSEEINHKIADISEPGEGG